MKKAFTILCNRLEVNFIYRQFSAERIKKEALLQKKDDTALRVEFDTLTKLCINIKDLMDHGENNRLKILNLRKDLEEAILICEEPEAVIEARKRLDSLPTEEDYKLTFDRETAKFVLKLLDREIEWIRKTNIPNIEKRDAKSFEDPIMTKSFYINKAKRAKTLLEGLRKKLETELV